jgi:parvulin-like peptidyl-prolyl isomerase
MLRRETFIICLVMIVCTGAVLAVLLLRPGDPGATDRITPERYREIANELFNQALYPQAVGQYDRYLQAARPGPDETARIHYHVAKIHQDKQADFAAALARLIMAKNLAPAGDLVKDINNRMIACLEHLERSIDAQALLRERTRLTGDDSAPAARPGEPIAKLGDRLITMGDFEAALAQLPPYMAQHYDTPEKKFEFYQQFIARQVLADAAGRKGYGSDPEIQKQLGDIKQDLMVQKLLRTEVQEKSEPTAEEVRLYYEAHSGDYIRPRAVEIAHLQVKDEDQARELLKQLRDGADFAELCREHSADEKTRDDGGYIGFIEEDQPIPGLGEQPALTRAAFDVKVGEYSYVVESDLGYHLLKVLSDRPRSRIPFEQAAERVRADLTRERMQKTQQDLLERYLKAEDIRLYEDVFLQQVGLDSRGFSSRQQPAIGE